MKILIICDMFPPAFGPRMGYLCKYMKQAGWEPVVLSEYINDNTFAFLAQKTDTIFVRYYTAQGKWARRIEWMSIFIRDFFFHYKDKRMVREAFALLEKGGFEGILCSTYRTFPLPAALMAARKFDLPLIADLRDIVEEYATDEYISHPLHTFRWLDKKITNIFRHRLISDRNNVLTKADFVTTVSPWHVETMKKYNPQTKLIYNGYDPELFFPEKYRTDRFVITYTGRLLSLAIRDPKLLFEAMERLDKEGLITPETFRLQWYVDDDSEKMIKEADSNYAIAPYMDFLGYVPASEIPEILNRSSVLLQLANKTTESGPKGFMTTKLFEAMAVEKPLLCVRSDEDCLEQTIQLTHTGVAARTADMVYDFLCYHYTQWKKEGYTSVCVNREAIEQFSRKKQAEQFMTLFNEIRMRRHE
ncbi:MAG: glycosyltransferase [Parabacteroides sp.]|nr:glycosyltransferase [Parabacteroides sp.]